MQNRNRLTNNAQRPRPQNAPRSDDEDFLLSPQSFFEPSLSFWDTDKSLDEIRREIRRDEISQAPEQSQYVPSTRSTAISRLPRRSQGSTSSSASVDDLINRLSRASMDHDDELNILEYENAEHWYHNEFRNQRRSMDSVTPFDRMIQRYDLGNIVTSDVLSMPEDTVSSSFLNLLSLAEQDEEDEVPLDNFSTEELLSRLSDINQLENERSFWELLENQLYTSDVPETPIEPVGVSEVEINAIQRKIFGTHSQECCSVCLSDFTPGEKYAEFPVCEHMYHEACLFSWLKLSRKCPKCRREI